MSLGTLEVRVVFKAEMKKIYNGKIKNIIPLDVQLKDSFISIQIYGIWKHISTETISAMWMAKN
ncbi:MULTISPECIES: hypothetical protein [Bacillus cereus group]|uniref:Uncharacterized protein n=2 Tax=Bacillus cereus group TaxID=86661 RepID=A0AAW5L957_BACCE|nr:MULTISPECIES: hypothetical protein [Bacillus cereus group]MCQ6288985.1 hypothetical protein [Bacillus cereus]MCQ6307025.1 hypothetical protein [Bacillus cereus]MCQ6318503.1 hypothetical protein [Bacillus cereus]MCQ6330598.1 hypothetical protein [Bacillus cereus]MCQ6386066.1 hypothetical protein [Bacillus cereus]